MDAPNGQLRNSLAEEEAADDGDSGSGPRSLPTWDRTGQGRWRSSGTVFWTAGPLGDGGETGRASQEASVWEKLVGTFDDGLVASKVWRLYGDYIKQWTYISSQGCPESTEHEERCLMQGEPEKTEAQGGAADLSVGGESLG